MKIGIFLRTTSGADKESVMLDLAKGIEKCGDRAVIYKHRAYEDCDIAVIFGFFGQNRGILQDFRRKVYQKHTRRKKHCIFIESDLLKMAGDIKAKDDTSPSMHYRVPFKSVYFGESEFFNQNSPPDRWNLLCERKKIDVLPYRDNGNHILMCMNRGIDGRGWLTKGVDTWGWLESKISEIRRYTDRPIRVRFHPMGRDYIKKEKRNVWVKRLSHNVRISGLDNEDIVDDCENAWASVVYNTSASVIPIVKGIPVFTDREDCIAHSIANTSISDIANPMLIDRTQWFYDLAYCMWSKKEMKDGLFWPKYKENIKKTK